MNILSQPVICLLNVSHPAEAFISRYLNLSFAFLFKIILSFFSSFRVLYFALKFLIHLVFIFVCSVRLITLFQIMS